MEEKRHLLNIVEQLQVVSENNDISQITLQDINEVREEIANFVILLPLMGSFNAGKSSLLNSFLNRDFLPVNIVPETAVATEIHYGEEEKLIGKRKNGKLEQLDLTQLSMVSSKDYICLYLYLNEEILLKYKDIILVDMPGVDSTVEEHNQAIMNYIRDGVSYIILADVEHGLKESTMQLLDELNLYDIPFSVLLTKTDRKLPKDINEMKMHVTEIVHTYSEDDNTYVGLVSAKKGEIADFHRVLSNLDKEKLTSIQLVPKVDILVGSVKRELDLQLNHLVSEDSNLDQTIRQLQRNLKEINDEIGFEEKVIEQRFREEAVVQILDDVEEALERNVTALAKAGQSGDKAFTQAVNSIIRPVVLKSADMNVQEILNDSAVSISEKLINLQTKSELFTGALQKQADSFSRFVKVISDPKYRVAVGGAAILTTIVAPWIELIVFFLPEILKIFVNNQKKLEEQIRHELIPEIISKLRPEVQTSLLNVKDQFVENMRKELEKEKETIVTAIHQAEEQKKADEHKQNTKIKQLQEALEQIQQLENVLFKESVVQ
ncbi:MAG: dynamin family protein [Bacillaceae bacterium]|nr:dynamin family protein [Bacillaceae bacterium]